MSSVTPNAEESTSSAAVVQIVKPKSARTYREVQPQQPPQPLPRRPQTSDGKTKIFTCCANFTSLQETPFGVCIFFFGRLYKLYGVFDFVAAGRFFDIYLDGIG